MEIPLSNGMTALVDDDDHAAVSAKRWHHAPRRGKDYAFANFPGRRKVYLHRFLCPGAAEVDHRNGDGLDNRKENLRPTTHRLNLANQRPQIGRASRFKGVRRTPYRWNASIKVDGKKRHLGNFATEEEAAIAYNAAALEVWGEFAWLNEVAA